MRDVMKRLITVFAAAAVACAYVPATAAPPHQDLLREIREGVRPEPSYLKQKREAFRLRAEGEPAEGAEVFAAVPPAAGTPNVLTLLFSFSDVAGGVTPSFFDTLVYGPAWGSVNHYYQEVSGGAFGLSTVDPPSSTGWLSPGLGDPWLTRDQYNAEFNLRSMTEHAIAAADPLVDFSQYDSDGDGFVDYLIIVHPESGGELKGDPFIWSRTTTYGGDGIPTADGVSVNMMMTVPEYWFPGLLPGSDMTIGIYAHEFGHLLGLPDLYDLGFDSAGIGDWGLMGLGAWNGAGCPESCRAETPAWMSAWSRVTLGWADPVVHTGDALGVVLPPVEAGGPVYYLWDNGRSNNEYFLIENRQQIGYDAELPGHGLLVWHVDEAMGNNNFQVTSHSDCSWPNHYLVALQQADGALNLELNANDGDMWDPYWGVFGWVEFSPAATPNSGSYADCSSLVALRNITETPGGDIVLDMEAGEALPSEHLLLVRPGDEGGENIMVVEATGDALLDPVFGGALSGMDDILLRGDVDGDGMRDLVRGRVLDRHTVEWNVHLASSSGPGIIYTPALPAPWHPDLGGEKSHFLLGDADGDGREDLIFSEPDSSRSRGFTWWVALSDGSSFSGETEWHVTEGSGKWRAFLVGDVNGDGRADLVAGKKKRRWSTGGTPYIKWMTALSNGFSFLPASKWGEGSYREKARYYLGDVTGDGAEDLVFSYRRQRTHAALRWRAAVSDPEGNIFGKDVIWARDFGSLNWDGHGLFDYDGDGLLDLLGWNRSRGMWDVSTLLSTGAAFGPVGALDTFPHSRKDIILP
jgi:M6 family metalloprotease-like protein